MKNQTILFFVLILNSLLSLNCATLLRGYESTVILNNAPDNIRVATHDGIEIPISKDTISILADKGSELYVDKEVKIIRLRNNKEYTLHLKYLDKEKVVTIYPKIIFWYAFFDFTLGVFPTFYDAYTGSWNKYPDIDAQF